MGWILKDGNPKYAKYYDLGYLNETPLFRL